jgi:rhamnosyltransferase subunit B
VTRGWLVVLLIMMNVVLATFGTDGDVFPFLGLGRELRQRGHAVSLAASGSYQAAAAQNNFTFHEIMSHEESERALGNPDFWHPHKAAPLAARWGISFLRRQYAQLLELVTKERTVLIANPGVVAARLVQERHGTFLASMALQPWLIPSVYQPPMMPGGLTLPAGSPRWCWRLYYRVLNVIGNYLIGGELNSFRQELGLPPVYRAYDWWLSPQLVLGLFPAWFGPPQPDWPPQIRLLSFPSFNGSDAPLSPELEAFLRAGQPPIAITFGTGIQSPGVLATPFAPFSELFPRCAAVIHHGGIGTTAKALTARVPQLIIPICFDQLDNAMRVEKLGCGRRLNSNAATPDKLALQLEHALKLRVEVPGPETQVSPAFTRAAELIETMAG